MINTIVRGVPSTLMGYTMKDGKLVDGRSMMDEGVTLKYLVRTFYHSEKDMYITAVWRLLEAEHDFEWAKNDPQYHHHIKDDDKNEKMFDIEHASWYLWDHICTHRKRSTNKSIGELHLQVCKEIMDNEYFDGEFAFP